METTDALDCLTSPQISMLATDLNLNQILAAYLTLHETMVEKSGPVGPIATWKLFRKAARERIEKDL